ncbi:hypothetical protein METBIDRAFT_78652 [Metschnikowia bicuspidata var. bicuspidata NRRL YB-4993]|uniref:RNI-like protein n=1 Tax=Metschnikowia bicuspidata var. bicuspidata NRRL YB-4993 TaxID=869754 RepID=A0A1A0H8I4_9ASCO|nr:hypothetical protein METBIDRAFT_78652 [Metschnikowia bicuspidata var. bicuspidata NRRL YB-4993]OBA20197.1 hypothetical protein METBIDRAFT_78652 [Metschnikowia bicuspidata var. bicuspidata NRRL YB-4993]
MKPSPGTFRPSSPSPLAEPFGAPLKVLGQAASPGDLDSPGTHSESDDDDAPAGKHVLSPLLHKLQKFPLFQDAPASFHAKVAAKLNLVQYHPQEYIIKQGDPALSMYWILKGSVCVASTDGESVYAELAPGSFFGEIGILFNRPRTASVVACLRVLMGVLTADALNSVLRSYPLIERRIRDEAQERLAMQEKKNRADIPIVRLARTPAPTPTAPQPLARLGDAPHDPSARRSSPTLADNVDRTVSVHEFLKTVPIFHNLPPHILHSLALGAEPVKCMPFEYIVRKGHTGSDIFFIAHGEVEVVDFDAAANAEKVLARLCSGSYFGEMSFLEYIQGNVSHRRSACIRSVSSAELIVIRTDLLKAVCRQYPNVVEEMRVTAHQRKSLNSSLDYGKLATVSVRKPAVDASIKSPLLQPSLSPRFGLLFDRGCLSPRAPSPNPLSAAAPLLFFINPNWNVSSSDSSTQSQGSSTRAVSPVSLTDVDAQTGSKCFKKIKAGDDRSLHPKKSLSDFTLTDEPLPRGPLDIAVPPKNPIPSFNTFQAQSRRNSFQYMPHSKRSKLSSLAGSRRPSVLVSTGSIPDKVLLGAFEFLSLPELMKLRLVSRRWRQLLYVAPNLFEKLDLSKWNTLITDQALISITDFVGSRPNYIDISNCFHVTDEGFSYLVNEVGMAGSITVFKMRCLWEVSAMAIMDLTSPSVGKHLQEVDFSNCRKVQDNVVERLIGWSNVKPGIMSQSPGSEGIYNNEAGSKHLRILNLGYCKHLTDNIMNHISVHANERLESLDLTRCTTITDLGFQYWTYKSFPNLKKLSLKDCTFLSDKAVISLSNAAPNLEILNLNFCCALLDLAIDALYQGCPNLRELDLSFCGSAVSDRSLVSVSLHLFNLQKLIVKGCVRVTRAGVDALLSGYAPLTYIDISQCRNAHEYPGGIPAQSLRVNPSTKSAFITTGAAQRIVEMVI